MHRFVENQGDAWTVTGAYLDRFIDEQRLLPARAARAKATELASYLRRMRRSARASPKCSSRWPAGADFRISRPSRSTRADIAAWTERLLERSDARLRHPRRQARTIWPKRAARWPTRCCSSASDLPIASAALLPARSTALKIRHHGDFHLGQMLIAKDDAFILDFEGEPRPLARRAAAKAPAARDVAGLIRSIDYSATAALLERAANLTPEERDIARAEARRSGASTPTEAFWNACRDAHDRSGAVARRRRGGAERLLDFFLLEKAFYEIEYELAQPAGLAARAARRDMAHPARATAWCTS